MLPTSELQGVVSHASPDLTPCGWQTGMRKNLISVCLSHHDVFNLLSFHSFRQNVQQQISSDNQDTQKNRNQLDTQKPSNVVCFVYAELCWALTPGLSHRCCFLICWMFTFSSVDHHQDNLCDNRLTLQFQFPFLIFIFRICSDLSAAQCCQTGISCSRGWVE